MGFEAQAQQAKMKGTISSSSGETLIGAAVLFSGTFKGSVTDIDGNYVIDNIDPGTYDMEFSFLGYTPQKASVTFKPGETVTKDIVLASDAMMLQEAVVVGYGTSKKEDLTGSAVVVTSKDFGKGNITTPEQLVSGKVSGIQITSNDGAPGSGSRIRIRGGSSLNASNDPLIVIDGVPVDNGSISGASNPLSLINPQDIESFVVLKDASAAAIYGSRGANGVILVTTKR
ncbi:MAG: TonB-dependent receptor plug domain-containing protein, partial [Bacteroidetes bacterium]|nr:TonB-dependent receptor plug domain-containing protein [Bacteroidota bacterium]